MRLYLSRLHYPITTLGWGKRVGIWFQGCNIHCPGCVSADTWPTKEGETTVSAVLESLQKWLHQADGITISGGEPLQQPEALKELLQGIRRCSSPMQDILVYSGYEWEKISGLVSRWDGLIDVLISDPYVEEEGHNLAWRGSDNQRMHLLSARGRERYSEWVEAPRSKLPKSLDINIQDGTVWMAGIPEPGMLDLLQERLSEAGFVSSNSESMGGKRL